MMIKNFVLNIINDMNRKEKLIFKTFSQNVLNNIRSEISEQIVEYLVENDGVVNSFKLQKLRYAFEQCGGNGNLLLPYSRLQRVKLFEKGAFGRPAFVVPIVGAEDFLAVFDCRTQKVQIEEMPVILPKPF